MPRRIPYARNPVESLGQDRLKKERDAFYSSARWRKLRDAFLRANPLCAACLLSDRLTAADTVHHIKDRLVRPDLALTWDNLEASCAPCHTRRHKTRQAGSAKVAAVHQPYNAARPMVLAVDFNGVIHDHVKSPSGKGPVLPDAPEVPGSVDFLRQAAETFTVAILSARFARPGSSGLESMIEARAWLIEHGIPSGWITFDPDRTGRVFLTGSKVPYLVALDDRSIRFDGTFPDPAALLSFKPWNVA